MTRTCSICTAPIGATAKTGRCRPCAARAFHADPANRAKLEAALRAAKSTPEHRANASAASRRMHEERANDPAWLAYKVASGKRLSQQYAQDEEAQRRNLARRAEVGKKVSARRLAWCPEAYRAEYRKLCRIMLAADARRVIMQQIAKDERARLSAMTPLQRDVERLRGGARLISKPDFRTADPSVTLGGVASGLL